MSGPPAGESAVKCLSQGHNRTARVGFKPRPCWSRARHYNHSTTLHSSGNWKDLEGTLSQDMSTLSAYLQTWRLKLSHTKTVTAAFHLNNREAKRELKVYNNGRFLPFCQTPTYLGVKLDRSLTFRHHLMALSKKLSLRVTLLRRLVGSGWGAGAKTLRIAALSLVYSAAEYCGQSGVAVLTLASLTVS